MATFQEVILTDKIMTKLIHLSQDWEAEKSCYGSLSLPFRYTRPQLRFR